MDENRKAVRSRRLKEARIVFNDRRSVVSCIVRDASTLGARVTLGEPYLVPHDFELRVNGEPSRPARKIWVRRNEMGLRYI